MKRFLRSLLLTVLSLAICVGVLEVVLRTTHLFGARVAWTEPDPLIGWRFTPGREYWFNAENDHPITGRINSMGWRDRERVHNARAARVAVLGDSFVEAFQVELDSTFLAIAERRLTDSLKRPVEILNFGRSGMGSAEALLVLKRDVLPLNPSIVVLVFTPHNDVADVNPATASDGLRPFYRVGEGDSLILDTSFNRSAAFRARARLNPLKQHSALVSLVAERWNVWRRKPSTPAANTNTLTREQSLCTSRPDPVAEVNYELNMRLVREVARIVGDAHGRLVVMAVPIAYEQEDLARLRALAPDFNPNYFDQSLANTVRGALGPVSAYDGVPPPFATPPDLNPRSWRTVALTPAFTAWSATYGDRLHWSHWNYAGHRLAGEVLADTILALMAK